MRAAGACFGAGGELLCAGCGEPPPSAAGGRGWRVLAVLFTVSVPVLYVLTLR